MVGHCYTNSVCYTVCRSVRNSSRVCVFCSYFVNILMNGSYKFTVLEIMTDNMTWSHHMRYDVVKNVGQYWFSSDLVIFLNIAFTFSN